MPFELGTAIALNANGTFIVAGERGALGGTDTNMFAAKFNDDLTLHSGCSDSDPVSPNGTYVYDRTGIWTWEDSDGAPGQNGLDCRVVSHWFCSVRGQLTVRCWAKSLICRPKAAGPDSYGELG